MKISNANSFKREFNFIRFVAIFEEAFENIKYVEILEKDNEKKIAVYFKSTIIKYTVYMYSKYFDVIFWENHDVKDIYRFNYSDRDFEYFLELLKDMVKEIKEIIRLDKISKIKMRKILARR